jgi:hypothetical protein
MMIDLDSTKGALELLSYVPRAFPDESALRPKE